MLLLAALLLDEPAREVRVLMHTVAEIQVSGVRDPEPALAEAFREIQDMESRLSKWDPESEISKLNERREGSLSQDAIAVLEHAIEVAKASGGAFDPTLMGGGYEKIRLDRGAGRARLEGTVTLDLGSVAKGHAADRALESLHSKGASAALVDLGTSSVAVFGEDELVFHIRNPLGGPSPASFRLRRGAIGSSSEEQQGSHIVDPWTGEPARKGVLAATVIARNAAEADALSTAVFVLGEAEGLALLKARGAAGVLLLEEEERLVVASTPGFAERYALEIAEGVGIR